MNLPDLFHLNSVELEASHRRQNNQSSSDRKSAVNRRFSYTFSTIPNFQGVRTEESSNFLWYTLFSTVFLTLFNTTWDSHVSCHTWLIHFVRNVSVSLDLFKCFSRLGCNCWPSLGSFAEICVNWSLFKVIDPVGPFEHVRRVKTFRDTEVQGFCSVTFGQDWTGRSVMWMCAIHKYVSFQDADFREDFNR